MTCQHPSFQQGQEIKFCQLCGRAVTSCGPAPGPLGARFLEGAGVGLIYDGAPPSPCRVVQLQPPSALGRRFPPAHRDETRGGPARAGKFQLIIY